MQLFCRKVRAINASYTIGTKRPVPKNGYQALLVPVESQHEKDGGIVEIHIWTFEPCPFEEGKRYNIPVDDITEMIPKTTTSYEERKL